MLSHISNLPRVAYLVLRLSHMGSDVGQIFPTASLHRDHSILYALVCEKEISLLRGWILNQARGLQSPSLNSNPEGEISLSYMNRLMMDCFSPTFSTFFGRNIKSP